MGSHSYGIKKYLLKIVIILAAFFSTALPAGADLTLNLIAVNGADTEKEINIHYPMPRELGPEDIIDTGPLKPDYDIDHGVYFVYGKVKFNPKESKTFKVRVKDVWVITPEEIEMLKKQLDDNLSLLQNKSDYADAQKARDIIFTQLDFILGQQQNYSDNIDRRIEEYRQYVKQLDELRDKVYNLDFLERESKSLQEVQQEKTVKFVLEVQNPLNKDQEIKQKHYLPQEIHEDDIVDKQGFDVRFDEQKATAFLSKTETFGPGEKKRYEVLIKDIWQFSLAKADALQQSAETAIQELKDSIYAESGQYLYDAVTQRVQQIRDSQQLPSESIRQHIGLYRTNTRRYDEAQEDVQRMEKMLAIVRAKKLEELEGKRVKNVLSRLTALRGLAALSEAIFRKGISVTMTWRIVFGTILFVAFFTGVHFFLWSKRSKRMGEDLAPKGEGIKLAPKPGSEEEEEAKA